MKRRWIFLLAAVVVVLALVVIAWPRGPREPVYQGKKLTQWIDQALPNPNPAEQSQAQAALQAIGTNALPFLLNQFTRPISPKRDSFKQWVNRVTWVRIRFCTDAERIYVAGRGLTLLGSNAAPVIPIMMRYLDDPDRGGFVIQILHGIGDVSITPLTTALSSTNAVCADHAAIALQMFARSPGPGRDALAQALHHPSAKVREVAVRAWASACSSDEIVVTELEKLVTDPSPRVLQVLSNHLGWLNWRGEEPICTAASNVLYKMQTNAP